jgi:NAD(P)H dehydrogenase (quinone)
MHVLVVYAHPNPQSFSHALLEKVAQGLADGGHTHDVVDLYGEGFDPVFRMEDLGQFVHPTVPDRVLDEMQLRERMVTQAGGPIRQLMVRRWLRGKERRDIVDLFQQRRPRDVVAHQARVTRADALIFVSPVFWMNFPAILKGWLERVFAYGFAYYLTPEGWNGHLSGRVPLLRLEKALLLCPTFFTKEDYEAGGWEDAIDKLLVEFSLTMPGARNARRVFFYAAGAVDDATRAEYLEQAYTLGKEF